MYPKLKGEFELNEKKFLEQVYSKIKKRENLNIELKENCIEIDDGKKVIFKIDPKVGMFYSADKSLSNAVDKLYNEIQPIVCNVEEYLNAMDSAQDLKALNFNMPYKKLLKYNNVILAGTEHSDGSFEFVTWEYKNGSLNHGHYYDDYEKAKEDFVKRSVLLPENQIFSADERFELYRCVEDTLSAEFELSSDVENILADVKEKLKESIPDFDERLTTLDEQDQQQEQKM